MNTVEQVKQVFSECLDLIKKKNSDYADSWRVMRLIGITDQIHVKVKRIIQLENLAMRGEAPKISEGIDSEYKDILNYCIFALIKLKEQNTLIPAITMDCRQIQLEDKS